MRRLPIFFLIDVSESMVGEPIQQVEEGLAMIVKELKSDPYALETVWISIIVFAGQPRTLVPLQEIVSFYPPRFPIGSGTSLAHGLGHLMFEMRKNVVTTTTEQKGDWKPIVFLFTDGVPTDDTLGAIREWKSKWQTGANMVAVSFGDGADLHLLGELTQHVMLFKNTTPASYKAFFQWITASIKTNSVNVDNNRNVFDLTSMDGETISKVDLADFKQTRLPMIDRNYAVMAAKCQNTKRPYLIKYKLHNMAPLGNSDRRNSEAYVLMGAYQVDQSYFELSDERGVSTKIHTDKLMGAPHCPCCGNQFGFAMCACGGILCHGFEEVTTCPWCGMNGRFVPGGDEGFDVTRTQG